MPIRITTATARVLQALLADVGAEFYGRELMKTTGLQSGSLYPILLRLEKEGVITSQQEEIDTRAAGRPARRYYRMTGDGVVAARQALAEVHELTRTPGAGLLPGLTPQGGAA
ncbi:PadR family transcriptional regulator [Kitasatospora purpeofusca]|uniref:PadR family transcriptional regulator n=1 Tax=Kitasatospora purpeofusca TaxID=67352 RepID=UPI00369338E8